MVKHVDAVPFPRSIAISAYPALEAAIEDADAVALRERQARDAAQLLGVNAAYRKGHRLAVLPQSRGLLGQRVKGSIRNNGSGYVVTYSYLIGFDSTTKAPETFLRWLLAIGQYREHDRTVQEKARLEQYRNSGQ